MSRQEIAAQATRREILAAARRLFAEQGYANTSVQQIAAAAGVAVQTLYSSVGAKPALLLALNDLIDEEAGVGELAAGMAGETEPRALLARAVRLTRQLNERCGDLIVVLLTAQPAEPEVAAVVADGMRRHATGSELVAQRLKGLRALPRSVPPRRAADILSLLTSPQSWQQLTRDAGWTFDDAETWIRDALERLLLTPSSPNSRSSAV